MNRPTRLAAIVVAAAVFGGLAACTDGTEPVEAPEDTLDIRVMQFNIEYGGTVVDFDSVPAAIEAAGADVVALQEAYGRTCKVADSVDWPYCDPRTQVISKYPLVTPSDPTGAEVLVVPEEAKAFGVVNLHLPSAPFGPNLAKKGLSAEELIAKERGRLEALEPVLDAAGRLQDADVPVVVLGDFNAPSHRDWTAETVGLREHVSEVDWPVSQAVEDAGFTDAYRTIHPDPVTEQGLTWPAARPEAGSYNPALTGKPSDRIDMTFVSSDITVEDSLIVGEESYDGTDIAVEPWPTDHRGVVTQMTIPLADPGPYVSASRTLVDQGINVPVFGSGEGADEVAVTAAEGTTDDGEAITSVTLDRGVAVLGTADLPPGQYTLNLVSSGGEAVATGDLWVREPGVEATISTNKSVYASGERIELTWQDAPGNKWDWIGVFPRGADANSGSYANWLYTEATVQGSATIDAETDGGPWPIPPGKYDVMLLADDSYAELARASFTVVAKR